MTPGPQPEARGASGQLPVVAALRIGRVEVRRVVQAGAAERKERRVDDVGARPAVVVGPEAPLGILGLDDQRVLQDSVIVRVVIPVRDASIDLAVRIDDEALHSGVVGSSAGVGEIAALDRVIGRHGAGQLDLAALVQRVGRQHDAGLRERDRAVERCVPARCEKPQLILHERTAEGALVDLRQRVGVRRLVGAARHLEGRRGRPRGVDEVDAAAAGKAVAAALRDRVHHAAAKPAVFRGDPGRENLRLLDGILDEQVLRRREDVVVDVDAVDHEHVVERETAVDDDLKRVRRVLGQARRKLSDTLDRAWRRQQLDLVVLEVGADDRRRDGRRRFRDNRHALRDAGRPDRDVLFDRQTEQDVGRLPDGAEATQLERHLVVARREVREHVPPFCVGRRLQHALEHGRGRRHAHTPDRQAVLVSHRSTDGAALNPLRKAARRPDEHQQDRQ